MSPETVRALAAINRRFYRTRGDAFGARRQHHWPGWERLCAALPAPRSVLDLGCGNARFGAFLRRREAKDVRYLGVDASPPLLTAARGRDDLPEASRLVACDFLEAPGALPRGRFDWVTLFGVLHHVPGQALRRTLLAEAAARLAPGGALVATLWRLHAFPRLTGRGLGWERVGLAPQDVDAGDVLLPFEGDPEVPRYCHALSPAESAELAASLPLPCSLRFLSDGREGSLNEYLVWRAPH